MKNVQFTQTEVELIVNAISSEITTEVTHTKPNYELIGKLTAIKHKIVHSPSDPIVKQRQVIVDPQHIKSTAAYLEPKNNGAAFPIKGELI